MGLLDDITDSAQETVADVIGEPEGTAEAPHFNKKLRESSFTEFGGDVASGDGWHRIAEFVVPAQESYRWGYGKADNADNQGYMYVELNDGADTQWEGQIRLIQANAQETNIVPVFEDDLSTLDGSKTDKTQQVPLPEQVQQPRVGRDSKLALEIRHDNYEDVDGEVSEANSDVILPVTVYTRT